MWLPPVSSRRPRKGARRSACLYCLLGHMQIASITPACVLLLVRSFALGCLSQHHIIPLVREQQGWL